MIELKPETEQLVLEEMENGHFLSIDEIILAGVRTRQKAAPSTRSRRSRAEAVAHIRAQRKGRLPEGVSIRDLIDEGRA